ncbi:enoyl-CoA hydratase [Rubrivivax sp. JA1024]|nr:enoyl-CoA hydratase [Rubrivivax sp. JA1024]
MQQRNRSAKHAGMDKIADYRRDAKRRHHPLSTDKTFGAGPRAIARIAGRSKSILAPPNRCQTAIAQSWRTRIVLAQSGSFPEPRRNRRQCLAGTLHGAEFPGRCGREAVCSRAHDLPHSAEHNRRNKPRQQETGGWMSSYETILVERPDPAVARIVMNRPDARNAQNLQMTYDLNAAFDDAVQDDSVKVIILAGAGPHFSAGHDLRATTKNEAGIDFPPVGAWGGFREPGAHGRMAREQEIYLQITRRWRNLAKPMIAEVHGKCIAGGLMLAWACDLIVAADSAEFCDPVVTMGVCGVEWFVHPWELGPRKAKELLFTADSWSAQEAHQLGMVNHVVPAAELSAFTMALAQRIAAKPSFALKMTKEAVNRSVDIQGQPAAIDQAFALHQLCHAHNLQEFGMIVDPSGLHPSVRKQVKV